MSYSFLMGVSFLTQDDVPDWKCLKEHLCQEGKLAKPEMLKLINAVSEVMRKEPNMTSSRNCTEKSRRRSQEIPGVRGDHPKRGSMRRKLFRVTKPTAGR